MSNLLKEKRTILAIELGTVDYERAWELQRELHQSCVAGAIGGALITLEHEPVLTFGKNADPRHLLVSESELSRSGIGLFRVERGGEVTAHNPGQLVVYPILPIKELGLSPRSYVALLEEIVIELLDQYGIAAATDPINPGVWVGSEKVCALGIRVKERVSMHGLALNVANDLSLFSKIVPCGISSRGVTSMSKLLGKPVVTGEVAKRVVALFEKKLDINLGKSFGNRGLPSIDELRMITS